MRKTIIAGALGVLAASGAAAADVSVTLVGVEAAAGPVYVSLQDESNFPDGLSLYGVVMDETDAGDFTVTIEGVDPGVYAVSVWHDVNGNDEFDWDDEGYPLDGWALSGEPEDGPATFENASFTVAGEPVEVEVWMVYPDADE